VAQLHPRHWPLPCTKSLVQRIICIKNLTFCHLAFELNSASYRKPRMALCKVRRRQHNGLLCEFSQQSCTLSSCRRRNASGNTSHLGDCGTALGYASFRAGGSMRRISRFAFCPLWIATLRVRPPHDRRVLEASIPRTGSQ
jgi:hypothetical protein